MKIAYLCEPQLGGTFTFFLRLRAGLQPHGLEVRCVPPISGEKFEGSPFYGLEGVDYVRWADGLASATKSIVEHLVGQGFQAVVILPGCDLLTTNLVRYLPETIRTVGRIPMATQGAYRPLRPIRDYVDRVVCLCDKSLDDLKRLQVVPPRRLELIYNGADIDRYSPAGRSVSARTPLRLLFAGRLEDVQKNIMMVPQIVGALRGRIKHLTLHIAGSGPDEDRLRQALAPTSDFVRVIFHRGLSPDDLIELYRETDVFLLPSRFEGSPNALLEAMSCGCVPVVSRLAGCTDIIVREGRDGFLCRVDDAHAYAARVAELDAHRDQLAQLSLAARDRIVTSFTQTQMVDKYVHLFRSLMAEPARTVAPLPLARYRVPYRLKHNWRSLVPARMKKVIRNYFVRQGKSV